MKEHYIQDLRKEKAHVIQRQPSKERPFYHQNKSHNKEQNEDSHHYHEFNSFLDHSKHRKKGLIEYHLVIDIQELRDLAQNQSLLRDD